ncbi:MAG: methionyl-tRNA formyltransferase [Paludibacter sp.]|nr:methionyl-tRNA formyltransferase [Bacteroidales bacterium]MCM1069873.1 methionyl-tRNA formyltransferase [Prevotella sp.]MCM1353054.1 methionyl-tRNA formyltransferase [Bacteroides sp.]MCM1443411.1 methionyl-tRNA formyltransferase [Muribaculum sp.]MCM1481219.1 methionyl-tRNA formyltransferase [Paludibacter sp.]
MDKKDLRIIYMGTPDFAVASLKLLYDNGYNVVAVVTMPDKPAGRGHKVQFSAVKEYALSVGLPVLQPEKLKDEKFLEELRSYRADLQIVVAFRMLPEVVWNMPRLGTFNLHGSLLPQYRGAAPINWAIINGEKETGVTTFFLKHEIDTGDMILQQHIAIGENEDAGSVHDRLMEIGAQTVQQTVDMILNDNVARTPQPDIPDNQLHSAPKIFKETCEIDFRQTAQAVHNFVRGLSPHPTAWCTLNIAGSPTIVKIYAVRPKQETHQLACGTLISDGKKTIRIAVADGFVEVMELQLPGKKRMTAQALLNGIQL